MRENFQKSYYKKYSRKKYVTGVLVSALTLSLGMTGVQTFTAAPLNDQNVSQATAVSVVTSTSPQKISSKTPTTVDLRRDDMNYTVYVEEPEVQPAMIPTADPSAFTSDSSWDVQWPFPVGVTISSQFGHRTPPCDGCSDFHRGTDFAVEQGTPVQPIAGGTVTDVGWDGDFGYRVVITHTVDGQLIESTYGHMVDGSSPLKVGDKVKTGELIGKVGSTGKSTGPHLHLQIKVQGIIVDPVAWLKSEAGVGKVTQ